MYAFAASCTAGRCEGWSRGDVRLCFFKASLNTLRFVVANKGKEGCVLLVRNSERFAELVVGRAKGNGISVVVVGWVVVVHVLLTRGKVREHQDHDVKSMLGFSTCIHLPHACTGVYSVLEHALWCKFISTSTISRSRSGQLLQYVSYVQRSSSNNTVRHQELEQASRHFFTMCSLSARASLIRGDLNRYGKNRKG
jgi:hypothetical protein